MSRDDLEAVIRHALTTRDRQRDLADGTYADNALTDRILSAADAYATAAAAELLADIHCARDSKATHYDEHGHAICGLTVSGQAVTADPAAVTCGRCMRADAWKNDRALTGKAS